MDVERNRRKWLFASVVGLLDWGLISAAGVAITYDEIESAAILLLVGAVVLALIALTFWSAFLGGSWKPSSTILRRIRLSASLAYVLFIGVVLMFALTFGWRYFAAARPDAFALFRISTIGSIIMLLLTSIALYRWQASLRDLEHTQATPSGR